MSAVWCSKATAASLTHSSSLSTPPAARPAAVRYGDSQKERERERRGRGRGEGEWKREMEEGEMERKERVREG